MNTSDKIAKIADDARALGDAWIQVEKSLKTMEDAIRVWPRLTTLKKANAKP